MPFTHTLIRKQGTYDEADYDGQVVSGDRLVLKLTDICLMCEGKSRKIPHSGNLSRPGFEPGLSA